MTTPEASPTPIETRDSVLSNIHLEPGLSTIDIADELWSLPSDIDGLTQQEPTTYQDSATVVYLSDPTAAQPRFGVIVVLKVEPSNDAGATIDELRKQRWGNVELHTVTSSGAGSSSAPAFVEFWRVFPPGQFAIPNQPVYFLIWYQAGLEYAFMIIGGSLAIRAALRDAIVEALD